MNAGTQHAEKSWLTGHMAQQLNDTSAADTPVWAAAVLLQLRASHKATSSKSCHFTCAQCRWNKALCCCPEAKDTRPESHQPQADKGAGLWGSSHGPGLQTVYKGGTRAVSKGRVSQDFFLKMSPHNAPHFPDGGGVAETAEWQRQRPAA